MTRIVVSLAACIVAVLLIYEAIAVGANSTAGTVLLNIGTEVAGIAITVAVIDWIFERRRKAEEAKKMAWQVLHEVDHAIWVWLGGKREFAIDELLGLLGSVDEHEPIAPFTGNMFLLLGSRAQNTLRNNREIAVALRDVKEALEHLAPLAAIRDSQRIPPSEEIVSCMRSATYALSRCLKLDTSIKSTEVLTRKDSSSDAQRWRYYGDNKPPGLGAK